MGNSLDAGIGLPPRSVTKLPRTPQPTTPSMTGNERQPMKMMLLPLYQLTE